MWSNTLMVLTSDNGGYTQGLGPCSDGSDPVKGISCMTGEAGATNYPMRGGKYSLFEGGIRANSFVSGGFLPASVRGTTLHGVLHIADWWATYCGLVGVDPADAEAAAQDPPLPPIDSIDMWPLISGATTTSPRSELFVTSDLLIQGARLLFLFCFCFFFSFPHKLSFFCLSISIIGDWKLIVGSASSASWPGPRYPNASSDGNTLNRYTAKCSAPGTREVEEGGALGPCLYNVGNGAGGDWTEHNNVAATNPAIVAKMYARLVELRKTEWSKPANASKAFDATCLDTKQTWNGKCVWFGCAGERERERSAAPALTSLPPSPHTTNTTYAREQVQRLLRPMVRDRPGPSGAGPARALCADCAYELHVEHRHGRAPIGTL